MDAQAQQQLNELIFRVQGMAQKIADLEKEVGELKKQRDTSASPRPQRSVETFGGKPVFDPRQAWANR